MAMPNASEVICDIIVVCWNQRGHTQRCLDSVCAKTDIPSRLILVDNGSETETAVFLESIQSAGWIREVRLLRNATNEGYARGVNKGLREATAPWVCLLNNDTIVGDRWLSEMVDVMESEPRLGLLNPASNVFGMTPVNSRVVGGVPVNEGKGGNAQQWVEATGCVGFCLLMRRAVLERVGVLDERFGIGYFEDTDYSVRARAAGYDCGISLRAYVFHVGGASFQLVADRDELFRRNEVKFYEKWPRERPERIAWILPPRGQADDGSRTSLEEIRQLANRGHKVWVFYPSARTASVPWHLSVVRRPLPKGIFSPGVLWGVLTKKKRFERIVVEGGRLGALLGRLQSIHRAPVTSLER